jgi:hypothetical protein
MPEAVADRIQASAVIARERPVVLVEVGDIGERVGQTVLLRTAQAGGNGQLDFAEALREGQLLLVGEGLIVEDQHGVLVHALVNGRNILGRERLGEVEAGGLADETRTDLADAEGHGNGLQSCKPILVLLCHECMWGDSGAQPRSSAGSIQGRRSMRRARSEVQECPTRLVHEAEVGVPRMCRRDRLTNSGPGENLTDCPIRMLRPGLRSRTWSRPAPRGSPCRPKPRTETPDNSARRLRRRL